MHACRKIDTAQNGRKLEAIAYYRIESACALACALLINICVVAVFARRVRPDAHTVYVMNCCGVAAHLPAPLQNPAFLAGAPTCGRADSLHGAEPYMLVLRACMGTLRAQGTTRGQHSRW